MNKTKNIISLSPEERYEYFIREVVRLGFVWGLSTSDSWIRFIDKDKDMIFPVWPHLEVANQCAFEEFNEYSWKAESIALDKFLEYCIPDMENDNVLFGVFYDTERTGLAITPQKIKTDISFEMDAASL